MRKDYIEIDKLKELSEENILLKKKIKEYKSRKPIKIIDKINKIFKR